MDYSNNQQKKVWIIVAVVAIIFCGAIYLFRTPIYQEFKNLKLVPQKEDFTELYFNNADSLPKQTVKGAIGSFSFTIHNEENAQTVYPYTVYFVNANGRRTIFLKDTVTLQADQAISIAVPYTFSQSDEKGMVVVSLTKLNQQIDFLVPNTN